MRCIVIHKCNLSADVTHTIHEILCSVQGYYKTNTSHTQDSMKAASRIFEVLQEHGCFRTMKAGYDVKNKGNTKLLIVGKQGRYLLYLDGETTVPSIVLMVPPPVVINESKYSPECKHVRGMSMSNGDDSKHIRNNVMIFSCDTTTGNSDNQVMDQIVGDVVNDVRDGAGDMTCDNKSLGVTSTNLLCQLNNPTVKNNQIVKTMDLFLRSSTCAPIMSNKESDVQMQVNIQYPNNENKVLLITNIGLRGARDALRNTGALTVDEEKCSVNIAQNPEYTLHMLLFKGIFKLSLYRTEDVFTCGIDNAEPMMISSHTFHRLDRVVEEKNYHHVDNSNDEWTVTGMQAVTNALLRTGLVAADVESSKPDHNAAFYKDITVKDRAKALNVMNLVSDQPKLISMLNGIYSGAVVSYTDAQILTESIPLVSITPIPVTTLADTANSSTDTANSSTDTATDSYVDFKLLNSNALNYAIWHQNTGVAGRLYHSFGLDQQEISTALYSGISFCHSIAYVRLQSSTPLSETTSTCLINETDFPVTYHTEISDIIENNAISISTGDVEWSTLRHNFHVTNERNITDETGKHHDDDDLSMYARPIECHVTQDGLIFFRIKGSGHEHFAGAVYVVPSIYHRMIGNKYKHKPSCSNAGGKGFHAIVPLIFQLANMTIGSSQELLSNATKLLYYINAICIHKPVAKNRTGNPHEMLRSAWLVTNMIHASRICKGVNNREFCMIYARLSNLAALPLDSAGYWATVPYV
jgi:hypothetical protein